MTAIDKINQMASQALQKSAQDKSERERKRAEAVRRNREKYPEFARILDEMNTTFTVNGKTYPGGFMAKIVEIEDL